MHVLYCVMACDINAIECTHVTCYCLWSPLALQKLNAENGQTQKMLRDLHEGAKKES